ncbi:hypothetical protein MTO96_033337 [Rhipicephalus appendiculatus]
MLNYTTAHRTNNFRNTGVLIHTTQTSENPLSFATYDSFPNDMLLFGIKWLLDDIEQISPDLTSIHHVDSPTCSVTITKNYTRSQCAMLSRLSDLLLAQLNNLRILVDCAILLSVTMVTVTFNLLYTW